MTEDEYQEHQKEKAIIWGKQKFSFPSTYKFYVDVPGMSGTLDTTKVIIPKIGS